MALFFCLGSLDRASAKGCRCTPQALTHATRVERGLANPARAKCVLDDTKASGLSALPPALAPVNLQ